MRCYSCSELSLKIICKRCRDNLFVPTIDTGKIGTLDVISFYKYTGLEALLHTKHKPEGCLAKMNMKLFIEEFIEADRQSSIYHRQR